MHPGPVSAPLGTTPTGELPPTRPPPLSDLSKANCERNGCRTALGHGGSPGDSGKPREGGARRGPHPQCTQSDPAACPASGLREGRGGSRLKAKDVLALPPKVPNRVSSLGATGLGCGIQYRPRKGNRSIRWLPGGGAACERKGSGLAPAEATGNPEKELLDIVRANGLQHFLEVQGAGPEGSALTVCKVPRRPQKAEPRQPLPDRSRFLPRGRGGLPGSAHFSPLAKVCI